MHFNKQVVVPSSEELPHLNSKERKFVAFLRRRRDFLETRVASSEEDLSYDKAEAAAISWALTQVAAGSVAIGERLPRP